MSLEQSKLRVKHGAILSLFGLLFLSMIFVFQYRARQRSQNRRGGIAVWMRDGQQMGGNSPSFLMRGGRPTIQASSPQRVPRFFANLYADLGDYVISVRQVVGDEFGQNLYVNRVLESAELIPKQAIFSMQVLSTNPKALAKIKDFCPKIVVTDINGIRKESDETQEPVQFPQGWARLVRVPASFNSARTLKSVEGELILNEKNNEKRLPFRIENIPLPIGWRVFGTIAAAYLPIDKIPDTVGQNSALLSQSASNSLLAAFPPYVPETHPIRLPWRVILPVGSSSRFPLYVADKEGKTDALECDITPQVGDDGEITSAVSVRIQGDSTKPKAHSVVMWDGEKRVLALPDAPAPKGKMLALRFHLFLNWSRTQEEANQQTSPFPAEGRERGAVLAGALFLKTEPLSFASVQIGVLPQSKTGEKERKINCLLNDKGEWSVTNFAPGRYRFRLTDLQPSRPPFLKMSPLSDYFRRRYGLKKYTLQPLIQEVEVRPGASLTLKPWVIMPTKGAQIEFSNRVPLLGTPSRTPKLANPVFFGQGR